MFATSTSLIVHPLCDPVWPNKSARKFRRSGNFNERSLCGEYLKPQFSLRRNFPNRNAVIMPAIPNTLRFRRAMSLSPKSKRTHWCFVRAKNQPVRASRDYSGERWASARRFQNRRMKPVGLRRPLANRVSFERVMETLCHSGHTPNFGSFVNNPG